jgi:hypothetical protein
MGGYFSAEGVATLHSGRGEVHSQFASLREHYFLRAFKSARAREYAMHGFCRRLGTLIRAIDQVYELLPPQREDIPAHDEVVDATIAIQSFVLNTFGCLDNLAWIWVCEKEVKGEDGLELDPKWVGLGKRNRQVRKSFSSEYCAYLNSRQSWFDHIKEFRDALAHRIPLYIPPYIVPPQYQDEYNRLEEASGEALRRADFAQYDRLQSEQKQIRGIPPVDDPLA